MAPLCGAIGVGAHGAGVLRDLFKHPDAQGVAVCNVNQDNLSRAIHLANERYGKKDRKRYANFRELLERSDIDAVVIAARHHWHAAMGVAASKAGKDIPGMYRKVGCGGPQIRGGVMYKQLSAEDLAEAPIRRAAAARSRRVHR
jgi:hypothetical protein